MKSKYRFSLSLDERTLRLVASLMAPDVENFSDGLHFYALAGLIDWPGFCNLLPLNQPSFDLGQRPRFDIAPATF